MITEQDIRREYVSAEEATQLLNVNDSRVRQISRANRFPGAFKFADTWLIPRESVANYTRGKPGKKKSGESNVEH